jgi:hypothetical protein
MPETAKPKPKNRKAAPKPADAEKRIARPLTPAALSDYGELDRGAEIGEFDPGGPWTQHYRIWMTGGDWDSYRGRLILQRVPSKGGGFELRVEQSLLISRIRAVQETQAVIQCADDPLATTKSWRLTDSVRDVKTGEAFEDAAVEQTGVVRDGEIEIVTNGLARTHRTSTPVTSNWSLFEAVQRLPGEQAPRLDFALLDNLDALKGEQRLSFREETEIAFGGSNVPVVCYNQIGRGVLPYRYYVYGPGVLLLAHTDLRAYILDPQVVETHKKKVQWLANKEMK